MGCKLTQDIKHDFDYNPGGIKEILLLDMDDFVSFRFREDGLYNRCYVESIGMRSEAYIHLDVIGESGFVETKENGIYQQELTTFVRTMDGEKTARLLELSEKRYIVLFRTYDKRVFAFGSDGGATLQFTQESGQLGAATGYNISILKQSVYPLFEVDITNPQVAGQGIFDITFDFSFE